MGTIVKELFGKRFFWRHARLDEFDLTYEESIQRDYVATECDQANLVGSLTTNGMHMPLLDLDIPAFQVESTSPGHSHLYINVELTALQYGKLLRTLHEVGLIQTGILNQWNHHGQTFLRLPWVRKQAVLNF